MKFVVVIYGNYGREILVQRDNPMALMLFPSREFAIATAKEYGRVYDIYEVHV
jgi:hypothetical protein